MTFVSSASKHFSYAGLQLDHPNWEEVLGCGRNRATAAKTFPNCWEIQ
jgi:hypothetical protein